MLAREALTPVIGPTALPFIFFFPAIAMVSWYGGLGPGALAAAMAAAMATWSFFEPVRSFAIRGSHEVLALLAFLVSCAFIVGAIEAMHRARARALKELAERQRIEAELAQLRENFAVTLSGIGKDARATDFPAPGALIDASPRYAKSGSGRIALIFLSAAILIASSTILVYRIGLVGIHAQETMSKQLMVLQQPEDFLSSMKDAETGQRGYLLTGDEPYLQPDSNVSAKARTQLDGLRRLARSGELSSDKVDRVAKLTEEKLSELERTIQLRREKGLDAALAIVRDNHGKQLMNEIHAEIAQMHADEEKEFTAASARAHWAANLRSATVVGVGLSILAFLLWAFRKIWHRREAAILETSEQRELLAITLASIGDAVIATDANGNVVLLNPEAERLTGWRSSEAVRRPLDDVLRIVNERTRKPCENPVGKVLRLGGVVGLANHTILISKDGREIPIDDSAAPIRNEKGSALGVVLVFRDVTEQRGAQQDRARLAEIVKYSGDAIITKDLNGILTSWNESAQRLFGYEASEIIGKHVTALFPPDRLEEEDYILGRLRDGQPCERLETIRLAKDGRPIHVSVSVSPIKAADGQVIGASKIIHDVTELVAAREALIREKELLATTLASIGDGVIITDAEGRVTFLNNEAQRLTGWTNNEADQKPLHEVFRIINEHTRDQVENPVAKVMRLGKVVGLANHTVLISRDGSEIPIDDSAAPIRQSGGTLFGVVLVFRDFTDRKRAENERERLLESEQALRHVAEEANRLKDEFLAIMSHELRNPLNVILGYSELLVRSQEIGESPQLLRMAEAIKRNAVAQSKLIRDLLDLSRLRSGKLELNCETVSLITSINNAIDTVRAEADAKQIAMEVVAGDDALFVNGDPVRLEQIVWNLLNNSVKFTPVGGRITVRVNTERNGVSLTITDTGQGIHASFLPYVFEMFRQADGGTNRSQSGMGIGLAVVQQLVELHKGSITASSDGPNKGASFMVTLPVSSEKEAPRAPIRDLPTNLKTLSILVVDDSEDTTEMLAQLLKFSGASVKVANSGGEALRIISENQFDVVLSDIAMPAMDGFEFLRRLRQLPGKESLPVVALTGFGRPEDIERARAAGFFSHVTKPFELEAIMETLRKLRG